MTHIKKYVSLAESQKPRATHESGNSLTPKIKLPTIEIPKFRGQITEFRHFYDTFSNLITLACKKKLFFCGKNQNRWVLLISLC